MAIVATMQQITAKEAKNRFGQLLHAAQQGPVRVTRNGTPVCVMVSVAQFERLHRGAWDRVLAAMDAVNEEAGSKGLTSSVLESLFVQATINTPDGLLRRVEVEAARQGLTVREVTAQLYRRWLGQTEQDEVGSTPTAWPDSWIEAAHEAMKNAPPGPTAREHLAADRNRLEPK